MCAQQETHGRTDRQTDGRIGQPKAGPAKSRDRLQTCLRGVSQLVLSHQWITADKAGCFYQCVDRVGESKRERERDAVTMNSEQNRTKRHSEAWKSTPRGRRIDPGTLSNAPPSENTRVALLYVKSTSINTSNIDDTSALYWHVIMSGTYSVFSQTPKPHKLQLGTFKGVSCDF